MLVNNSKRNTTTAHVKFISYTGKYPNLCSGTLTLEIDGKEVKFGYRNADHQPFWTSGGNCGFYSGYADSYVNSGEWEIRYDDIPKKYQKYASEIDEMFNSNVPHGCCGGCL